MQNHPKNSILSKFQLSEPQHHSQVVIWSSSDSSDCENNYLHNKNSRKIPNERVVKKRKREENTISFKNISRFDYKYNKIGLDIKGSCDKSPVLNQKQLPNVSCTSPIFKRSERYSSIVEVDNKSPNTIIEEIKQKSPVLLQKYISPKFKRKHVERLNTSKKNCKLDIKYSNLEQEGQHCFKKSPAKDQKHFSNVRSMSPILKNSNQYFLPIKVDNTSPKRIEHSNYERIKQKSPVLIPKYILPKFSPKSNIKQGCISNKKDASSSRDDKSVSPDLFTQNSLNYINIQNNHLNDKQNEEFNNNFGQDIQCKNNNIDNSNSKGNKLSWINLDKTSIKKLTNSELKDKMKTFISNFSSSSSSEYIISECETSRNSLKRNDAIESSLTVLPQVESSNHHESSKYVKPKKISYDKGGLAFRLHELLKKQNALSCLWFHERFLGIQLKEEEYTAYKIERVDFNYGSYLVRLLNSSYDILYLYLNSLYVKSNTIVQGAIIKLYEPYKIIDFDSYKLIINVCKYECIAEK